MKSVVYRLLSVLIIFALCCSAIAEGTTGEFDRDWLCPVCNALLNEQEGFKADLDSWVCKVCGSAIGNDGDPTLGFDPEEAFKNARFPGYYWYCDKCEAFLNIQSGFDDHYDSWTCEECGHVNPITEADVYDNEYEYRRQKGVSFAPDGQNYTVTPRIYESEDRFSFLNAGEKQRMTYGEVSIGQLTLRGDIIDSTSIDSNPIIGRVPAFALYDSNFSISYTIDSSPLDNQVDAWELADCKDKSVDGIKLDGRLGKGTIIVQVLNGDNEFETVSSISNCFADNPIDIGDLYTASELEFLEGSYYRVIVAYQTRRKVGQKDILFIHNDEYENRFHVESYVFYAQCDLPVIGINDIAVKESSIALEGTGFESSKNYKYVNANPASRMAFGRKTLGTMMLDGQICGRNLQSNPAEFGAAYGWLALSYAFEPKYLKGVGDGWELCYDKSKKIDDVDLGAEIGNGAFIVLKSPNGEDWEIDDGYVDAFTSESCENLLIYTNPSDVSDGMYYRILVAYQTKKLVGTEKKIIGTKDKYDYMRHVEVYDLHLHMDQETISEDLWSEESPIATYGFEIEKYSSNYRCCLVWKGICFDLHLRDCVHI